MSHIQYTICRNSTYYYNRRVPKHAVNQYGQFIRCSLCKCPDLAAKIAHRLSVLLEDSWNQKSYSTSIDIEAAISSYKPKSCTLSELVDEYTKLKNINPKVSIIAAKVLISLVGDKNIQQYTREDAKLLVSFLTRIGNKTATIRRRLGSLSGVFNYAYAELEIDKRNPFSRILLVGEGLDRKQRGTFTNDQLLNGYKQAFETKSSVKLLMPILGETGCRLGEIVGLKKKDICLTSNSLSIAPNQMRRLKTRSSERVIPLVGYAYEALELVMKRSRNDFVFDQYNRGTECKATHASNAVNKWLRRDFHDLTAHYLRHTFRDRLRAVECPMEIIDELGGWSTISTVGNKYGLGHKFEIKKRWMRRIQIVG